MLKSETSTAFFLGLNVGVAAFVLGRHVEGADIHPATYVLVGLNIASAIAMLVISYIKEGFKK